MYLSHGYNNNNNKNQQESILKRRALFLFIVWKETVDYVREGAMEFTVTSVGLGLLMLPQSRKQRQHRKWTESITPQGP